MQGKPRIAEETAFESFIHSHAVRKAETAIPEHSYYVSYCAPEFSSELVTRFPRPIVGQGN